MHTVRRYNPRFVLILFTHFLKSKKVFSRVFFLKIMALCMVSIQERVMMARVRYIEKKSLFVLLQIPFNRPDAVASNSISSTKSIRDLILWHFTDCNQLASCRVLEIRRPNLQDVNGKNKKSGQNDVGNRGRWPEKRAGGLANRSQSRASSQSNLH